MYTDPDGKCPVCVAVVVGAVIGGITSGSQAWVNHQNVGDAVSKGALVGGASGVAGFFAPAGILMGTAYGAATGAVIGAGQAALFNRDIGKGALMGGILGGVLGGITGGITAHKAGGNVWTGELYEEFSPPPGSGTAGTPGSKPVPYNNKELHKFRDIKFPNEKKGWVTMAHRPSHYTVNPDGSWANTTTKTTNVLGVMKPSIWGGYRLKANIYIAQKAFASQEDLFVTLGHEFTHRQHYLDGLFSRYDASAPSYNYNGVDEMTERGAWEYVQNTAIQNKWNGWYQSSLEMLRWKYPYGVPADFNSRVTTIFVK
jgi:hypothetical protein